MQMQKRADALNAAIQRLRQLGVNLLALDFDETLISIHTHGRWQRSLEELSCTVRPEFKDLVRAAIASSDIHVAIVTLSCQPNFVRGVLESLVGAEQAAKIPVRGGDLTTWSYTGQPGSSQKGKQAHLASVLEELQQRHQTCDKSTTLLIDDDYRNIRIALKDGVRAIWFDPSNPQNLLHDIVKMVL